MITNELYDNPYNHEIRNYEVSLWTLQDEFITVLKWSDVEHKGTIQDPKLTIADDGTENFTFTIPMYIYERGQFRENPIWYNTRNGNLMVNLRKIKIIFNKLDKKLYYHIDHPNYLITEADYRQLIREYPNDINKYQVKTIPKRVFELLITKITEEHEQDHLFCNVECEGLAFHELGKIGYTEALAAADFELDYKDWQEKGYWTKRDGAQVNSEPIQNVQYWCNARLGLEHIPLDPYADIDPRKWYYDINMCWDSFEKGGVIELDNNNQIVMRDTGKVYEESFVTDWHYDVNTNKLLPGGIAEYREKERAIEISESNLYNITQTIAENFGIFCRYIYTHDDNNHIVGRKILFFNNYLHDENIMSLTYPYSSQKVVREMDATDVVTKLYVKSVENSSTLLGEDSIRYCDANQMQEDYIFNFDYLRETNSITEEQYAAIDQYIKDIHYYNSQIIPLQNKITVYQNQELELEAKIATYTNSAALAQEQIDNNSDYIQSLLADHGVETNGVIRYIDGYNAARPDTAMILQDENGIYYINLNVSKKGIKTDSVRIFREHSSSNSTLSNEVTNFSFKFDEYGNPIRIYGVQPIDEHKKVYLTYSYEPRLYYDAIIAYFEEKHARDTNNKEQAELELLELNNDPDSPDYQSNQAIGLRIQAQQELKRLILEKEAVIKEFNYMMGPALREGNWAPENYQDYGERHNDTKEFPIVFDSSLIAANTNKDFTLIWDNQLFDSEQDIYYELGINQEKKVYPCVNLSKITNSDFWNNIEEYSFIFNSNYYDASATLDIRNIKSFKIGSEALLGFITSKNATSTQDNNTIYPVLILVGAKTMTDQATNFDNQERMMGGTIGFMMDPARGAPRLGVLKSTIDGQNVITEIDSNYPEITITSDYWTFGINQFGADSCQAVYPRIKFSSLLLKYQDDKFFIHKNGILLTNYEDYSILNRNLGEGTYAPEFYVTIKPLAFLKNTGTSLNNLIQVGYTLSNAGTAIYLDAIEIAKENAYPKVSYTVDPNILNKDIIATLYDKLNWLVMINDSQLKLMNTFGYISKLELDLDFPDKDSIEIKNYKSKFEDLFSTIVASTESIKSNENTMAALSAGTYNISSESLANTLANNSAIVDNYLNNYFQTSETVQKELTDLFLGASEILTDSSQAISQLQMVNEKNNTILGSIAQSIRENYSPTTFRQAIAPSTFKRNDTWIEINEDGETVGTYTALCDSSRASSGYGWNKVYNGSLAQINGKLNIDADSGKVELLGENMYISGANSVEITGPHVNINSFTYENGDDAIGAGVFITAKQVGLNETEQTTETVLSSISIEPHEISMFGSKITMLTTKVENNNSSTVTAMQLDGENGIWLGSDKGITLFSNQVGENGGASIELMPTHLLLGVGNSVGTTAVKITPNAFVVASGAANANTLSTGTLTGIKTSLTGVKISDGFFGVVTKDSSNNVNAIIMNNNGLTLAYNLTGIADAGDPNIASKTGGSYVRLSGQGIDISSEGHFIVSASNFKLTSSAHPEGQTVESVISPEAVWTKVTNYANGTNTCLKLADDEIYITATRGQTSSYAQIKAGLIDLHASNTEYIKMSNNGLQLQGRSITINGEPIWSNQRIQYSETRPSNPTAPGLSGQPWIWIAPKLNSQWVYSHLDEVISNGNGSVNGAQATTQLSSSAEPITDGNTWYKYELTFNIRRSSTNGTETRHIKAFLRATVDGAQREVAFDQTNEVTISGANQSFKLTKEYNGNNISAYNVAAGNSINLQIGYWFGNSSWLTQNVQFYISSIILTISTNSASSGAYPCVVYYMVP